MSKNFIMDFIMDFIEAWQGVNTNGRIAMIAGLLLGTAIVYLFWFCVVAVLCFGFSLIGFPFEWKNVAGLALVCMMLRWVYKFFR